MAALVATVGRVVAGSVGCRPALQNRTGRGSLAMASPFH